MTRIAVTSASDHAHSHSTSEPNSLAHPTHDHANDNATQELTREPAIGTTYGTMIDSRAAESLCQRLEMTQRDVRLLLKQFNALDVDHSGMITVDELFFLFKETRRPLTKLLLRLAQLPPTHTRLTFDEYVLCVCSFASFTELEVFHFLFESFEDPKNRGAGLTEKDLEHMAEVLESMNVAFKNNIEVATHHMTHVPIDHGGHGHPHPKVAHDHIVQFNEFARVAHAHPLAFLPVLKLQRKVRKGTIGESYWLEKCEYRAHLEQLIKYMHAHCGVLPPLPFKDRVAQAVLRRQTRTIRLFKRAVEVYDARLRNNPDTDS